MLSHAYLEESEANYIKFWAEKKHEPLLNDYERVLKDERGTLKLDSRVIEKLPPNRTSQKSRFEDTGYILEVI
mgnify:CR=1 FL=1